MTAVRNRNVSFKIVATMGMVLLMAFFSACEVLATEGARDAIAGGREIREFEDQNLRPIEDDMNDLWVVEIQPREREIEDLRHELNRLQEELLAPLWESQNDPWAAGGEAAIAQEAFDEINREFDAMQRALDLEQRELDANWQVLWSGTGLDPEYQALEDLRYEKQRELDRLYRFGNRPIDDIWDQINELNSSQGFANTDSQIESEMINTELRRLWDLQSELSNNANSEVDELYNRANNAQNELTDLYNFGWDEINNIYNEIERLESEQSNAVATASVDLDTIAIEIANIQSQITSLEVQRDVELAPLLAELAALDVAGTTDSTEPAEEVDTTSASSERITELQGLIAGLEADAAVIVAAKDAEVDALQVEIDEKKASYDQLIETAEDDFTVLSDSILADAAVIQAQIDELEEVGGDDANAQIAELQPSYDTLISAEQSEEDALHVLIAGYETDREAGVDELKAAKDVIEELILAGLTPEIDAQIAVYQDELDGLLLEADAASEDDDDTTPADETPADTTTTDNTQAISDLNAAIEVVNSNWGVQISQLNNQLSILQNQKDSAADTGVEDSRIASLRLQVAEMETELQNKISNLEAVVEELYNQANNGSADGSSELNSVNQQIDELNAKLEVIWQQNSSNGLEILIQVQNLEKQARVLEEEREEEQYRLEEELWDIDDRMSLFYKDQNSGQQLKEAEYQAIGEDIQRRRFELDELRWHAGDDQQIVWDEIEAQQRDANEQIKLIEDEQLGALKLQIRELEDALQTFYGQQRDLEIELRNAQGLVEDKKRELEDKVFDALESAAGTVDEAGGTLLTATEESGSELFESDVSETPEVTETPETTDAELPVLETATE